ncbi:hypothetical protein CTAYLR_008037 [Chrysophaeum taylorii]|uniref:EF-hand domain-containing protein n=1 Tax=Chrysophaeum taylorii TaxID=2483200 RepID=A0AAD7U9G6_9STRA|nr:hypothetical protein CTAYLR_008037 [Chrysophaeum taylorii]
MGGPSVAELFDTSKSEETQPTPGLDALRNLLRGIKPPAEQQQGRHHLEERLRRAPNHHILPKRWRGPPEPAGDEDAVWPVPTNTDDDDDDDDDDDFAASRRRRRRRFFRRISEASDQRRPLAKKKTSRETQQAGRRLRQRRVSLDPLGMVRTQALTPRELLEEQSLSPSARRESRIGSEEEEPDAGEPPLASSMALIRSWMASFNREEKGFDSLSVFFETRLREAVVQTSGVGMIVPNRARAATCCDLLLKLPRVFGRYAPLVTTLVTEVVQCVYKGFDARKAKDKASDLFEHAAWFDLSRSLQKRAAHLQAELKENSEGAGLAQMFRQRFILWDDRNLILRCILFRGWRKHARTMVAGRARLALMRLQYWFDRLWEGIELEREEKEFDDNSDDYTTRTSGSHRSSGKRVDGATLRRSVRASRRSSQLFSVESAEASYGVTDLRKATEISLRFLGTASNRVALLRDLDALAGEPPGDLASKDVLLALVKIIDERAGVAIAPALALLPAFARGVSLHGEMPLPIHGPPPPERRENVEISIRRGGNDDDDDDNDDDDEKISEIKNNNISCEDAVEPTTQRPSIEDDADFESKGVDYARWLTGGGWETDEEMALALMKRWLGNMGPRIATDVLKSLEDFLGIRDATPSVAAAAEGGALANGENEKATQTEEEEVKTKRKVARSNTAKKGESSDKDPASHVAITSTRVLIPLVYDRLLDACSGEEAEARKVKLSEVGKHALIRRFGIKSIATNYYQSMLRAAQTCSDRDPRIALFRLVFSIESLADDDDDDGEKKSSSSPTKKRRGRGGVSKMRNKGGGCDVIEIFCALWHNYFKALQVMEATQQATSFDAFLQNPKGENGTNTLEEEGDDEEVAAWCAKFREKLGEFQGASAADVEAVVRATSKFTAAKDVKLVRQGDAASPPALVLGISGEANVYVRPSLGISAPDELVARLEAPFVVGEGRLLTGMAANATIITTKETELLVCKADEFDALMDARNSALLGLEANVVARAEERVEATGVSVSQERILVYREFFTDVDVTRSGTVTLTEVLEAFQARGGTKVSTREIERAFKECDADGDLKLNFDDFIKMCDSLVRRGKRLFDKGTVSDVLKAEGKPSLVLFDALLTAVERAWKHTATHKPAELDRVKDRLDRLPKLRVHDPSAFLPTAAAATKGGGGGVVGTEEERASAPGDKAQGYAVVDADEAILAAMEFWELEVEFKNKLARLTWAKVTVAKAVIPYVDRKRARREHRRAWVEYVDETPRVSKILRGPVTFESFVDVVEEAYGTTITDALSYKLFEAYEESAAKTAADDPEACAAARDAFRDHVAAIRIQLWSLRTRGDRRFTFHRRSRMVVLGYVVTTLLDIPPSDVLRNCADVSVAGLDVATKIAHFLVAARTAKVNTEAAFEAIYDAGLRLDAGRAPAAPAHHRAGTPATNPKRKPHHGKQQHHKAAK